MEGGGRQSRLLGRLLGRLRGEHHRCTTLDKNLSLTSTGMSESTGCGSFANVTEEFAASEQPPSATNVPYDEDQFAANIDLRYSGQYLTPEQLPEFCNQLHHLVEVIRNIQSYARITGEYPSELERRLEQEASEVAALAAETRNARDVISRTRAQRIAVSTQKKYLATHLADLKETEIRELESTIRLSDRKLFKNWEAVKDCTDPAAFKPLLQEIRNKQAALECLVRLIDGRQAAMSQVNSAQPLPPPLPRENNEESSTGAGRKRSEGRRSNCKRRRKEAHSVPLSNEPSRHSPTPPQVTLYIQGSEASSRYRVGSAGAVALTPLDLPSRGSVRDIVFFTAH